MRLTKPQTFRAILAALFGLCLLYQSIWIFSRTTTAKIYGTETTTSTTKMGNGSRYINRITWLRASYKAGGEIFDGMYLRNGYDVSNPYFEVRYLTFSPDISRANTFVSNWGPLIMAYIVLALIASIAFIRKDIIADKAIFVVQAKRPFIQVQNNRIEDYDQHDLETKSPTAAEEALRSKLDAEANKDPIAEIYASQYKFNPAAIGIFVCYVILFFFSFYLLLNGSLTYTTGLPLGAFLLFVPLYVQNTSNPKYKAKIPDEGSLTFSLKGVQIQGDLYALEDIDAAVVRLESFQGFQYTDHTTMGKTKTTNDGDNNKISFRYKGQVVDLTFILINIYDYWVLKKIFSIWASRGVNVLLEKVFTDDFIIQETMKYDA